MSDKLPIREVLDRLLEKAKEDGVITEAEQAILRQVELDISVYEKQLAAALEDNIITAEESAKLRQLRGKILESAWVKADEDAVISNDEAALLNLLLKLLRRIELEDD